MSVNKVILLGNLGQDVEVKYFPDGRLVANFSIATSSFWKDKSGERQQNTQWHRVAVFGALADVAKQFLKKGSKVYLEGKMSTRSWQDKNSGQTRYITEVIVGGANSDLRLLDKKENYDETSVTNTENETKSTAEPLKNDTTSPADKGQQEYLDDDIPF